MSQAVLNVFKTSDVEGGYLQYKPSDERVFVLEKLSSVEKNTISILEICASIKSVIEEVQY